jgi:hypothetical protein
MTPVQKIPEDPGTPEQFEAAIWEAYADLFITYEEALKAIQKYSEEWAKTRNVPLSQQ